MLKEQVSSVIFYQYIADKFKPFYQTMYKCGYILNLAATVRKTTGWQKNILSWLVKLQKLEGTPQFIFKNLTINFLFF